MVLARWVTNVVDVCMAVQPGEKVFVITDEPMTIMRQQLVERIAAVGASEVWSYVMPDAVRPLKEYPATVLKLAEEVDVLLGFEQQRDHAVEVPRIIALIQAANRGQTRFGWGPYLTEDILEHELSADYNEIADLTNRLAERLKGSSHVRITTALGTDLEMDITGREIKGDTGMIHTPGQFGNLPAGECYVAPLENRTNGVFIVDKSYPDILIQEPITLHVENGRVVAIQGGSEAQQLLAMIADGERQEHGEGCRVVCEFGIGTNPNARLLGKVITDEKVLGTVHVAIGHNAMPSYGGQNHAPIHLDGVISGPTVVVDGVTLLENGQYVDR